MRLNPRRILPWALAGIVVVGAAFAVGLAAAPQESTPSAPSASGPHAISLPKLVSVAALPQLRKAPPPAEAPTGEVTAESTPSSEGEGYVPPAEESYSAPVEESAPPAAESPAPSGGESPSSGGGGGGGDLVPEG